MTGPRANGPATLPAQAGLDDLDHLFDASDQAARRALAHLHAEEWLDVDLAETLLDAARALRSAGRSPSPAVVEAMQRCAAAHRAWAEASQAEASWAEASRWAQDVGAADPQGDSPGEAAADPDAAAPPPAPIRIAVGLGDLVKGVMRVRRS